MREHGEWNGCMARCRERKGGEGHVVWCRERKCGEGIVVWCGVEREKMVRKKMRELGIEGERWTGEEWVVSESVHGGVAMHVG